MSVSKEQVATIMFEQDEASMVDLSTVLEKLASVRLTVLIDDQSWGAADEETAVSQELVVEQLNALARMAACLVDDAAFEVVAVSDISPDGDIQESIIVKVVGGDSGSESLSYMGEMDLGEVSLEDWIANSRAVAEVAFGSEGETPYQPLDIALRALIGNGDREQSSMPTLSNAVLTVAHTVALDDEGTLIVLLTRAEVWRNWRAISRMTRELGEYGDCFLSILLLDSHDSTGVGGFRNLDFKSPHVDVMTSYEHEAQWRQDTGLEGSFTPGDYSVKALLGPIHKPLGLSSYDSSFGITAFWIWIACSALACLLVVEGYWNHCRSRSGEIGSDSVPSMAGPSIHGACWSAEEVLARSP